MKILMKIQNLDKYIAGASKVSYWIDFLRLNLIQKISFLSEILNKLNDTNSDLSIQQVGDCSVSFIKSRARNSYVLKILLSIDNIPYDIGQYVEYLKDSWIKSVGSLTYYWTYYRLLEMWLIDYSFEKALIWWDFKNIENSNITRLDYKIDFFYNDFTDIIDMDEIVKKRTDTRHKKYLIRKDEYELHKKILLDRLNQNKSIHYNIKTKYNQWDFQNGWTQWNKKNKSIYIRCYEKIIDSLEKGKYKLYDDYFLYKNVFRLEIEFLSKFNKKEGWRAFVYKEISQLEDKIRRFMWLSESKNDEKFIYQYKENKETKFTRLRRIKEFAWRGLSLYDKWFNPFRILYEVLSEKMNIGRFTVMITDFKRFLHEIEEKIRWNNLNPNDSKNDKK